MSILFNFNIEASGDVDLSDDQFTKMKDDFDKLLKSSGLEMLSLAIYDLKDFKDLPETDKIRLAFQDVLAKVLDSDDIEVKGNFASPPLKHKLN